jgi:LPS sulfotransferase NodH
MHKINYIYILSQRYSGSTLLSFLLGTHPQIGTIGERKKFYIHSFEKTGDQALSCSCGKPFPECEHWNTIKSRVTKRIGKLNTATNPTDFKFSKIKLIQKASSELFKASRAWNMPLLRKPLAPKLKYFKSFNRILVEEILKLGSADVFLDSSNMIDQLLFLSMIQDFDLKVVWLTRDPRAQVNSALKYNKWTVAQATDYWIEEMRRNEYWLDKMNINYTSLNYEALCHDPETEMIRLLDFLKLDSSAFSLDFRQQTQHIMGNYNMRLGADTKIAERKEWLKQLRPEQISTIEKMTTGYTQYYSKTI